MLLIQNLMVLNVYFIVLTLDKDNLEKPHLILSNKVI